MVQASFFFSLLDSKEKLQVKLKLLKKIGFLDAKKKKPLLEKLSNVVH